MKINQNKQDKIQRLEQEIKMLKLNSIDKSKYLEWDANTVINWIFSLQNGYYQKEYGDKLKNKILTENLNGKQLNKLLNNKEIRKFDITLFKDVSYLQDVIEQLAEQNSNNGGDDTDVH